MKKNIIWLAVIVLLLGAMAGALIALNKAPAIEAEPSSSATETIFVTGSYADPMPDTIEIENETGRFTIYNKVSADGTEEPGLEGYEAFSLDTYGLNNALNGGKYLTAKRVVEENATADALSAYGFDKPRATVTAKKSTETVTILVGDDAPGGEGTYVTPKDSGTVYLAASILLDPFLRSEFEFINKTITETDPEFTGFNTLVLSGENYPETIIIEKIPEAEAENYSQMLTHRVVSPLAAPMAHSAVEPLASLYGLLATKVVSVANEESVLQKYRLENPAADISVTSDSQALTFALKVSAPNPDGTVYLIKNGSPVIYQLDQSALPWLSLTLFDYMDKLAVIPHIDSVSAINLTIGGKLYAFAFTGEGDELAVTLNGAEFPAAKDADGKDIDAVSNFRKLYQTLISAKYTEETEEQPAEDAPLLMSIEYSYKSGKASDTVRFYGNAPARRAYIVLNGGTAYLTNSTYIDRLAEDVEKLAKGEQVKVVI